MITVEDALDRVLSLAQPMGTESVFLRDAAGRVLAQDAVAKRNQPPFASSAMDGYAVQKSDLSDGATLTVIGEAAAGNAFDGSVKAGTAVRIFTGAPVPDGADFILIQEDCTRTEDQITLSSNRDMSAYVRPAGGDFAIGDALKAPKRLGPNEIALLASMNVPEVDVFRKPKIALVATGDELVMPGETPNDAQIISSNNFGLKALLEAEGAEAMILPIASDTPESLSAVLELGQAADLIVTLGGASVGDHDLVQSVAGEAGLDLSFYKVSMRPGKPLMAGLLNETPMIGLPGNPVSSMVCGHIFVVPALRAMLGLGKAARKRHQGILGVDLGPNGPRSHYMRATLSMENGQHICTPFERQDSSLLSVLSRSNCLMIRDPSAPAQEAGTAVEYILI